MIDQVLLLKHPTRSIYVRQFGQGARSAAADGGITVIIDNFRASNTILALLEGGARVRPVEQIEEAFKFEDYIKVGEENSVKVDGFDFDNSPYNISQNEEKVKSENVVIRTTNGTRGLLNAIGSEKIIVGSFRNLSAVVDYCEPYATARTPISFVAMGSLDIPRIEDIYGAQMMFYKLAEKFEKSPEVEELFQLESNPWNSDWKSDIKAEREFNEDNYEDRNYAIQLDETDLVPLFNPATGFIELANE